MDDPESWFWKTIDGQEYNFSDGDGTVEPLDLGIQTWEIARLFSLLNFPSELSDNLFDSKIL